MVNKNPDDAFFRNLGRATYDKYVETLENKDRPNDYVGDYAHQMCFAWSETEEVCESPIERLLLAELLFLTNGYKDVDWDCGNPGKPDWGCVLELQAEIDKYRADFLFTQHCGDYSCRLVVEADGHDFHERTKEQAKRDKSRDRHFTKLGITYLRFTGSEIWKDPEACAQEVATILYNQADELLRKAGILRS